MAEIGYAITEKLIEVLARDTINEICRLWNYESQLDELKQTVSTIQQVFLDADAKWDQLTNQDRDFIRKLKDVVYDAEDVFDEFRTRAELNQLGKRSKVQKFFEKVRGIFSSDKNQNPVYHAYRDVKDIKERLDAIAIDHKLFELKFDSKPIVRRPKETCSYIDASKIIGRDKDKESIINMLLDPNVQGVTIVGMGGLGKTALAQLVCNDERIKLEFLNRLWVCVSDQEGEHFEVKAILCKILELVTRERIDGTLSLESVQNQFQEILKGKKYFLVLDDVWNEDRVKWAELEEFLSLGEGKSKIIVTTRSVSTAKRIGGNMHMHRLDGLSQEDSQHLFEMSAFGEGEKNIEFVEIGKKIVGKCHRNPLAIKVIGSLLFGQDLIKWESTEKSGLAEISKGRDEIMPILKLSYQKLTPSLKSCFSYCAIFSKDFVIDKELLIGLWISHEYIVPFDRGQSVEDAAEEYFLILMRRCFFQDVKNDAYGNVKSFKIHDLMHDVAQEVRKEEICIMTSKESNLGERTRHVNFVGDKCTKTLLCSTNIRTFIGCDEACLVDKRVKKMRALRVLEVSCSSISKSFPCIIGSLLLLRFLDLFDNHLEVVPDSITKLYNLQTLILGCRNLRELPKDFSELVNLRHLDMSRCWKLTDMPIGLDKLTKLRVLPYFVVGGNSDNELKVLQVLTGIKGFILVKVRNNYSNVGGVNDDGGGYLKSMKHLTKLQIEFDFNSECGNPDVVLEKLEPPANLKGLSLEGYKGTRIPWSAFSCQHQFIDIYISYCPNLKRISALSRLPHLKSLKFHRLNSIEYMEDEMSSSSNDGKVVAVAEFFPALESLEITRLEKLQRWWKGELPGMRLRFPRLTSLIIENCPNLTSFAPEHELPSLQYLNIKFCPNLASNLVCPTVACVRLQDFSEKLLITCANSQDDVTLREVTISGAGDLKSISTNCLSHLKLMSIDKVESVLEYEEVFQRCASTLRTLEILDCHNLTSFSGLEHLTGLKKLILFNNDKLSIPEEDDEPWKSFHQTLRELQFSSLLGLKGLPKGMRHLTSLQSLNLCGCENLEGGLPEWMSCLSSLQFLGIINCDGIKSLPVAIKNLTSLKELYINYCPELEGRCRNPDGEDFPKIQHIPKIYIRED